MLTTNQEFQTFVNNVNDFHNLIEEKRIRFTKYECKHCGDHIKTVRPTPGMVESKGYWDGCKRCTTCGKRSFVAVYPTGETISVAINL